MAKGVPETHPEERQALNWSPKKNWVEKAGGLPSYINSVAVALVRGGMPRERAIPAAVSVIKRTCATGLWGGRPNAKVSPAIRAAACKAASEWEAKKGGAKLSACADCSKSLDLAGPVVTSKAGQPVTVNALMQGMKPRHVKALAKANRNLQRSGMPVAKRRKVLRSMAKGLRSGRVSLSAPLVGSRVVDLAFNPSEARGFHGRWVKTLNRIAKLKVGGDSVRVPLPESERRRTGLKMKRIERVASGGARQFRVQHAAHYTHHATPLAALHAAITPSAGRAGNVRSFSHSVDLAFNPSEMRAPKGATGGGRWAKGGASSQQKQQPLPTVPPARRLPAGLSRKQKTAWRRQQAAIRKVARQRLAAAKRRLRNRNAQHKALAAVNAQRTKNRGLPSNAHMRALALRSKTASNSKARVQAARDLAKIIRLHGSARTKARRQAATVQRGQAGQAASVRARAAAAARASRQAAASARASAAATARSQRQQAAAAKKAQAQRARSARAMTRPAKVQTGAPKRTAAASRRLVSRL